MDKATFISRISELQNNYKPNQSLAEQLAMVDLVATVGPTGVGKTTIMQKSKLPQIITDTTRPMRDGEKDGVDYNFRDDYEVLLSQVSSGDFAEFIISLSGEFYGVRNTSIPKEGLCTMAIIASAMPIFWALGFRSVTPVYFVPPSYEEWMLRLELECNRIEEIQPRLAEAAQSLATAMSDDRYLFVMNDNIDTAVEEFLTVTKSRLDCIRRSDKAKLIAKSLLTELTGKTVSLK